MFFNNNYNNTAQAQGHPQQYEQNQNHSPDEEQMDYYKHQLNAQNQSQNGQVVRSNSKNLNFQNVRQNIRLQNG